MEDKHNILGCFKNFVPRQCGKDPECKNCRHLKGNENKSDFELLPKKQQKQILEAQVEVLKSLKMNIYHPKSLDIIDIKIADIQREMEV